MTSVGRVLAERSRRDRAILATIVGHADGRRTRIAQELEEFLQWLGTDRMLVYFMRWPDDALAEIEHMREPAVEPVCRKFNAASRVTHAA